MKIRPQSDIHTEFDHRGFGNFINNLRPIGEEVLCLSGDIGVDIRGAESAKAYAEDNDIDVVMIAGNHEFYTGSNSRPMPDVYADLKALNSDKFHFLQNSSIRIGNTIFVGATLWTDFNLNGRQERDMEIIHGALNDYYKIWATYTSRFTPKDALNEFITSKDFLENELTNLHYQSDLDLSKIVVMTHHLPSRKSVAGRYADNQYNAGYASNLDDLVEGSEAVLWLHGHSHVSMDYMIGGTRIINNPRGYVGYEENPDFNPNLIIEI